MGVSTVWLAQTPLRLPRRIHVCGAITAILSWNLQLEHPMFSATFAGGEHECRLPATCCKPCSARVCQSLGCQQELRMHHSG
ncbi:unnamed protein product [Durusdinium trenchii]|uniref:Uncharacterized protein n=1 Tax=Durusdinium trenchii TaxID=1381693 RepID=A0ABP0I3G0_9DINO